MRNNKKRAYENSLYNKEAKPSTQLDYYKTLIRLRSFLRVVKLCNTCPKPVKVPRLCEVSSVPVLNPALVYRKRTFTHVLYLQQLLNIENSRLYKTFQFCSPVPNVMSLLACLCEGQGKAHHAQYSVVILPRSACGLTLFNFQSAIFCIAEPALTKALSRPFLEI